jgi:hypothetical protein
VLHVCARSPNAEHGQLLPPDDLDRPDQELRFEVEELAVGREDPRADDLTEERLRECDEATEKGALELGGDRHRGSAVDASIASSPPVAPAAEGAFGAPFGRVIRLRRSMILSSRVPH